MLSQIGPALFYPAEAVDLLRGGRRGHVDFGQPVADHIDMHRHKFLGFLQKAQRDKSRMSSRAYTHLRKDLREYTTASIWPAGTRPAPFNADRHAAEAHGLLATAYRLGGGHVGSFETWWPALRDDPEYDPKAFFLALDDADRVIGLAQCWTSAFLKDLAVAESWRRQGLGKALLLQAFEHFQRQGRGHFDLKVEKDNPSGAEQLYRSLGMRPVI